MHEFEIVFYAKENGEEPVKEFILSQPPKMRAKQATDITRVLYFFEVGSKIVLTNGFVKKTQRIPIREINKAKKYRADYERRRDHDKL